MVPEPNLEGVQVTLLDSMGVEHSGISDSFGNIVFPGVAPGVALMTIQVPDGWMLTTPATNPFEVFALEGPGAHALPPIGLMAIGPAVPERSVETRRSDVAAAVVGGLILLLLVAIMIKALTARMPAGFRWKRMMEENYQTTTTTTTTTDDYHHHHAHKVGRSIKVDYAKPKKTIKRE